jgi:predicted transcriptional regulator
MDKLFVVCIRNDDYPASLEKYKIYIKLHDAEAEKHHFIRLIDESGQDYLYPENYFAPVELPEEIRQALMSGLASQGVRKEKKSAIPLKGIVTDKYVICLECGKKMKTLKTHLRKVHNLTPKEYLQRFGLDPKKYPLVCKEFSAQRQKLAKEKSSAALRRRDITKSA